MKRKRSGIHLMHNLPKIILRHTGVILLLKLYLSNLTLTQSSKIETEKERNQKIF